MGFTVVSLPSCLCVCIAFVLPLTACTEARISRQSVALSARHSGPQKSRPQLEASTLYTLLSSLSLSLHSALGTRHSHGTLRGWSILPLARHLQICAPCTLTRTHIHSECTHSRCSHKKPFKQCQWGVTAQQCPRKRQSRRQRQTISRIGINRKCRK